MQNDNNNHNKHLTAQEIAICAEAISEDRVDKLPARSRKHLDNCMQCLLEAQIIAEISDTELVEPQNIRRRFDFKRRVFPLLAASLVLGIVIVTYTISQRPDENAINTLIVLQDSIAADDTTDTDATLGAAEENPTLEQEHDEAVAVGEEQEENMPEPDDSGEALLAEFIPDRSLEMLVSNYQSAYRGNSVSVLTPSMVSVAGHEYLVWENPRQINLFIEIVDNKANQIYSVSTTSDSVAIPDLQPGLYYWKLVEENDFDLLFAGKIIHKP